MENVAQGAGILRRPSLDQFVHVIRFHVPRVDLPAVWPGWNKRFTTRSSTSEAMCALDGLFTESKNERMLTEFSDDFPDP